MTKPVIGSKYVPPQRSYNHRDASGSFTSFMEFPHGASMERLQAALLNKDKRASLLSRIWRTL